MNLQAAEGMVLVGPGKYNNEPGIPHYAERTPIIGTRHESRLYWGIPVALSQVERVHQVLHICKNEAAKKAVAISLCSADGLIPGLQGLDLLQEDRPAVLILCKKNAASGCCKEQSRNKLQPNACKAFLVCAYHLLQEESRSEQPNQELYSRSRRLEDRYTPLRSADKGS